MSESVNVPRLAILLLVRQSRFSHRTTRLLEPLFFGQLRVFVEYPIQDFETGTKSLKR